VAVGTGRRHSRLTGAKPTCDTRDDVRVVVASVALLLLADHPSQAAQRVDMEADLCNGVCEFLLCVSAGPKPTVRQCVAQQANFVVRVQSQVAGPGRRGTRFRVGGVSVRLVCHADRLAACLDVCSTDAECATANGDVSRCVSGHCLATPACP
jgi:hypothetical protein